MKKQNRILATVLALALTLCALVSCGDNGGVTPHPAAEQLSAPVIQMEKGGEVNVVWDAVKGAVSYVATVNGEDLPAQTACSLSLTEDAEYTVSVRALAADAAYNSSPSNTVKISYGFNEDAVVLRFAALSDVHVSSYKKALKVRDMMLSLQEKYELDAFLFAGDLVDAQTTDKYNVVPRMAHFALGATLGNREAQLPLIWCFGNHDFPTYTLESLQHFPGGIHDTVFDFPAGTLVYDASLAILDDSSPDFFSLDDWPDPSLAVPNGFRYNLIGYFSFFSVDYTHVNADTLAFLKAQLDAVVAEDPERQIFVLSHMPKTGSSQPDGFTDLMTQYPQIVYISGHSHRTLQTYGTVSTSGGLTQFNLGPGDHAAYGTSGPGSAYNCYQMKQGAVIEVDANGRLRFTGIDFSLNEEEDGSFTSTLSEQYVVAENPMEIRTIYLSAPSSTTQSAVLHDSLVNSRNDERYHEPFFPEEATATFTWSTLINGTVTFSTADATNVIKYYIVEIKDMTTGELVSVYNTPAKSYATTLKPPANHIYYPSGDRMPDTLTLTLKMKNPLDASHEYALSITAVDDFGVSSSECVFTFTVG